MVKRLLIVGAMLGLSSVANCADVPGAVLVTGKWGNVWGCSSNYKVKQNTPVPGAKASMVRVSAARNEFEPFQLCLRPTKPLSGLKVTPHQLTGPKGAKLAAWNISVRKVEYVNVATAIGDDSDSQPGLYPDPLPELQPFTAPKGINSPLWLTVFVPDKTPAGDYTGTVDITATGGVKLVVPVKLHVWDFTLPSVSKLRTAFGMNLFGPVNYQWATTLEQKRKLLDLYNNDFWRHRVSPMKPYEFYDPKVELSSYQIKVDFSDFDIAVQKYFAMFNTFMLPGFGIGDNLGLDLGTQADRLKVEYMRMVTEHLANKGQSQKGYADLMNFMPYGDDNADAAIDRTRRADARIKVLINGEADPKIMTLADIVGVRPSTYDDAAAKKLKAKGIETWFSVSTNSNDQFLGNSINSPAINARILPWLSYRFGVTGMMYTQTAFWGQDPFNSGDAGNGRLFYPPTKTPSKTFLAKGSVPSIRWELIREGIEDYDYLRILDARMQQAKQLKPANPSISKAAEAMELVNGIASSVTGYTQDPAKLEAARVKVAEAIEGLR